MPKFRSMKKLQFTMSNLYSKVVTFLNNFDREEDIKMFLVSSARDIGS